MTEEGFADHIAACFVLLHHLPQRFAVVDLARRVARQTFVREQLFEIGSRNIGQQHATQRRAVHRQTGTNAHLIDARTGGADAGDIDDVAPVADRQMTAALADITQLLDDRLTDLRHIQ